jgi:hypothetical protein
MGLLVRLDATPYIPRSHDNYFPQLTRGFKSFWLLNFQSGHQPIESLLSKPSYLVTILRPVKTPLNFHPFVKRTKPSFSQRNALILSKRFPQKRKSALCLGFICNCSLLIANRPSIAFLCQYSRFIFI